MKNNQNSSATTAIKRAIQNKDENQKSIDTTITIVRIEGDTSAFKALENYNKQLEIVSKNNANKVNYLPIARPKLEMPHMVKGYTKYSLNSYAQVKIPRKTFSKNEFITLDLNFISEETLEQISPVFIEVVKVNDKNSVTLIWEQQFKATELNNKIKFSSSFAKGEYRLTIGFYFMDNIHEKFPKQYAESFDIKII